MKKKLVLLCVLALLVMGLAVNASAAENVVISAGTATVTTGEGSDSTRIEVPVTITGAPAGGYKGFAVSITYDKDHLTLNAARSKSVTQNATSDKEWDFDVLTFSDYGVSAAGTMGGDGTLFVIVFDVAQSTQTGEYEIKLSTGTGDKTLSLIGSDDNLDELGQLSFTPGSVDVTHNHSTAPETWDVDTAATCTTKGQESYTCTYCTQKITRETDVLGHQLESNHDGQEGDCTTDGKHETFNCTRTENGCGQKTYILQDEEYIEATDENKTIKAAGHKFGGKVDAKTATCTEDGWIEHYECTVCKQWFGDNSDPMTATVLGQDAKTEALNHKNAEHVVAKKPSVVSGTPQPGWHEHYYCPDCKTFYYATAEGAIDVSKNYGTGDSIDAKPEKLLINKISGDVDSNGKVDIDDLSLLASYMAGDPTAQINETNSDVDANNKVDIDDLSILASYMAGDPTIELK